MARFYCELCGASYDSAKNLVNNSCSKSPTRKHQLYEGTEKKMYTCKFCGVQYSTIANLVNNSCSSSPTKKHQVMR